MWKTQARGIRKWQVITINYKIFTYTVTTYLIQVFFPSPYSMVWKETSVSLQTLAESRPFAFLSNGFARIFWKSKMFQGTWGRKDSRYFRLASVAGLPWYLGVFLLYLLKTSSPTEKNWKQLSVFTWRHGDHVGVPRVEFFSYGNAFFCCNNLHRCWPREWKRSMFKLLSGNDVTV